MLARKTPLRSYTPLRSHKPMSKKRSKRARDKEFSKSVRAIVLERSSGICELCRSARAVHLHHAVYRSQGGTGDISNAIYLCESCHSLAHSKREVREWCVELAKRLAGGEIVSKKLKKKQKHPCVHCEQIKKTDLELEDGRFICEDCAQHMSDMAD